MLKIFQFSRKLFNTFYTKLLNPFTLTLIINIFSYFITFCGSIIYVRMLGKYNFGLYTFAFNIVSFFLLINGFGAASGILQYVSTAKTEEEKENYLRFAFQMGTLFNFCISILIILYALIMPLPFAQGRQILLAMALFPIGRLYIDVFQSYLRACGKNLLQAQFLITNNSILLLINLLGICCFKLYGLIYSTYLAYIIMFIYSSLKFKLPLLFKRYHSACLNAQQFISYSFFATLANAFSGLLFVLDIIIIGYIVKDPRLVAVYRVATLIPFAINFIPGIAVNFYYPLFAKNAHNPNAIRQLERFIRHRMFLFSFLVSVTLIIGAKFIIFTIFGKDYQDSILPFQIVSAGYWIIATFRTINGNILAALGKAKLSFYITSLVLILNIVITYTMVKHYSINGAAIAIVIIYILSSLISYAILHNILNEMDH